MTTKSILTYGSRVAQVSQDFYAPVAILPTVLLPGYSPVIGTLYVFLSRIDPWGDENNPDPPQQTQQYIKSVFKNIFVAKKITQDRVSGVISRVNWTSGTTYDYYLDTVDILELDSIGNNVYNFYVKNSYNQVFKCLWNNNGNPSTVEPFFIPAQYNTNNNIFQGSDGYKWKYIYSIPAGDALKYLDDKWMPIHLGALYTSTTPDPLETSAGWGDIEVINVTNGGSGYGPSNTIVTIIGDGINASGTANVVNGSVVDVIVTNPGSFYTTAAVNITVNDGGTGFGAEAIAPISPIGGHGMDPSSELGCHNFMFSVEFNGSEGTNANNYPYIPTNIEYRQLGLLINPDAYDTIVPSNAPGNLSGQTILLPANSNIYKASTLLTVAPGPGNYNQDEVIYQGGTSLATATFFATVLNWDAANNIIDVINITGTPIVNSPVFGDSSGATRTLLPNGVVTPTFIPFSGYMAYIENRTGITRSPEGIEQFKIVLGY